MTEQYTDLEARVTRGQYPDVILAHFPHLPPPALSSVITYCQKLAALLDEAEVDVLAYTGIAPRSTPPISSSD